VSGLRSYVCRIDACHQRGGAKRMHAVRHSVKSMSMEWLAGSRQHIVELLITRTLVIGRIGSGPTSTASSATTCPTASGGSSGSRSPGTASSRGPYGKARLAASASTAANSTTVKRPAVSELASATTPMSGGPAIMPR